MLDAVGAGRSVHDAQGRHIVRGTTVAAQVARNHRFRTRIRCGRERFSGLRLRDAGGAAIQLRGVGAHYHY